MIDPCTAEHWAEEGPAVSPSQEGDPYAFLN